MPGGTGSNTGVPGGTGSNTGVPGGTGSNTGMPGGTGSNTGVPGGTGSNARVPGDAEHVQGDGDKRSRQLLNMALQGTERGGWSARNASNSFPDHHHPSLLNTRSSYIISAPRLARPATVYRLVVGILSGSSPVQVTAHLTSPEVNLDPAHALIAPGESQDLLIQVPYSSGVRSYTLLVEGYRGHALVFRNSTHVTATPTFLTIIMHLSRPCFTGSQEVGVRMILLTTDLKPYDDPVDVSILDPEENIVKRWVSRSPHIGVVTVAYQLPELPRPGWWKVKVNAQGQVEEKRFLVHKIYEPLYEVFVEMPFYKRSDEEAITGTLTGSYITDKPVYGNASLSLYVKQPWTLPDSHFKLVSSLYYHYVDVAVDFSFPMESLLDHVKELEGAEVKVECVFHDVFTWIKAEGHSRTRILSGRIEVGVVGTPPFVFRPGMTFNGAVYVRHSSGEPLEKERLAGSSLVITTTVTSNTGVTSTLPKIAIPTLSNDGKQREETLHALREGQLAYQIGLEEMDEVILVEMGLQVLMDGYTREQYLAEYREIGIHRFELDIPKDAASFRIDVAYTDEHAQSSSSAYGYAYHHPDRRYIQVSSSTDEAKVGDFAIFHIRSSISVQQFVYMIISKGVMVYSASEMSHGDDVVTISIAVASSMAPRFTILVYTITNDGEVLADAISLPVRIFENMEVQLSLNQHKDHTKKTVEMVVGAPAGSFYVVFCQRGLNYHRQHPNAPTHARITDMMAKMEPLQRTFHRVLHRSGEGEFADRLVSLAAHSYASDVLATFQDAAVVLLSDSTVNLTPGREHRCDLSRGYLECGDGSCFLHDHLCDGRIHCANAMDELGCERLYEDFPPQHEKQIDPLELSSDSLFRLLRTNFIVDIFDEDDVNWCNSEVLIGHRGQEELQREIAKTVDEWVIEGYAIHSDYGLSFTKQPIIFAGDPPFYILVEGPSVCRRGEQISIRVLVFNMLHTAIQAVLLLHDSDDYRFIHVEKDGNVQHFHPRLSRGEHQHLLFIPAEGSKEVVLPLAVTRQSGKIEVTVEALSQVRRDTETWEIEVKPEGVPVRKHTSLLLDLRNRALVYEFLDIPVDESPIIPLSIYRRFLYGSPAARITIAGDVFGPTMDEISVDHSQVFGGRYFRSTDGVAFNFGATLWTLHYLRLTNQLEMSKARDAFDYLTVQLGGLLWRCYNGGFSMWAFTPPSVWLTAKVLNILLAAQHEDWENFLYIDPHIIQKSVTFLMKYQKSDGSFKEEGEMTLDSKMKSGKDSSVPLTALVAIVIHNSLSSLQGSTRTRAVDSRARAIEFLEFHQVYLDDCYHTAISAYALTLVGSSSAETAIAILNKQMRYSGDMTYWSRTPMTTHLKLQENSQRAFLLPREPEEWDSHAVETTSYALLVFLTRDGVTVTTERIMRWLNAVRDWDCAFISTVDTLVAMQALAEYAFRARLRDVTNIECSLDVTAQPTKQYYISITNTSTSALHSFKLENIWGHASLVAKGSGQAIAQLEVSWGVDVLGSIEQPHKRYFDLNVLEKYHQFRNKSIVTTTVCARWVATEDGHTSSAAMVEVEVPTGYVFYQPLAETAVSVIQQNGSFPQIRNVHSTKTHVFWQFDFIPSDKMQCFSYDIQRWYPAANLTAIRSATIMEMFAPEHFEMVMINATPLAMLDICEVCGSYQCPYCPIYSAAPSTHLDSTTSNVPALCCFFLLLISKLLSCPQN
nr:CD109 antigen-like [Procambarus clarkii]